MKQPETDLTDLRKRISTGLLYSQVTWSLFESDTAPSWIKYPLIGDRGNLVGFWMIRSNQAYKNKFGKSPEEYQARPDRKLYPKKFADRFGVHDRRVWETGRSIIVTEDAPLVTGEVVTLDINKFPVPIVVDGESVTCVGGRDLSAYNFQRG